MTHRTALGFILVSAMVATSALPGASQAPAPAPAPTPVTARAPAANAVRLVFAGRQMTLVSGATVAIVDGESRANQQTDRRGSVCSLPASPGGHALRIEIPAAGVPGQARLDTERLVSVEIPACRCPKA